MISIVLPVFNEEKNIAREIISISDFFKKLGTPYEIIAVNDGSTDRTQEILAQLAQKPGIKIILHKKNLGYGAALRSGFSKASGDQIFFTDSDLQFDIQDITLFLEKIKQVDFVVGYREKRADSAIRILCARAFGLVSRIFFKIKAKDIDCAFKLFNSYVLSDMGLISDGALINLEIFAKARKKEYKFVELPVRHFKRTEGRQTGGDLEVILKAVSQFFWLWAKIKFS